MEELMKKLMDAWDERPDREKTMYVGVFLIIIAWFSWSFVISGNLKSAWAAHKLLSAAEAEYKESVLQHKNAAAFKKKMDDLEADTKQKLAEEQEFDQKIKAPGQLEDFLEGLRSEADKSFLSLVTLEAKVTTSAPTASSKPDDKNASKPASVSYKKNNIIIVCRGSYRQTVGYLLEIVSIPRVMSLKSFSMTKISTPEVREVALKGSPQASKLDTAGAGDSPVETRLEMEVFFK